MNDRREGDRVRRLVAVAALACSACASGTLYDDEHRHADGWRQGIVQQVGSLTTLQLDAAQDCRAGALAGQRFALVWVRSNHAMRALVLPLAEGAEPRPRDWVLVQPGHCVPPVSAGS